MPYDIQLLIALAAPFLVMNLLRINAAMAFFSVCLGYVLVEFVAKDANSLIRFLAPNAGISQTTWLLVILLTPFVLTCFVTVFSMRDGIKVAFNALTAALTSVLIVIMAVPLLTPGLRSSVQATEVWTQIGRYQSLIISLGALLSLVFLWSQRHKAKKSVA